MNRDSIWFSLRNKKFRTLWLVTLISSSAVCAYNTAAVWLMNSLTSSFFFLSLIPVVTSLAFFLFTLPAGIIADVMSRTKAIALINLGLAFMCICFGVTVWLGWINPSVLLFAVLSLGIGFAFYGPAMAAIVPDLVSEAELSCRHAWKSADEYLKHGRPGRWRAHDSFTWSGWSLIRTCCLLPDGCFGRPKNR